MCFPCVQVLSSLAFAVAVRSSVAFQLPADWVYPFGSVFAFPTGLDRECNTWCMPCDSSLGWKKLFCKWGINMQSVLLLKVHDCIVPSRLWQFPASWATRHIVYSAQARLICKSMIHPCVKDIISLLAMKSMPPPARKWVCNLGLLVQHPGSCSMLAQVLELTTWSTLLNGFCCSILQFTIAFCLFYCIPETIERLADRMLFCKIIVCL